MGTTIRAMIASAVAASLPVLALIPICAAGLPADGAWFMGLVLAQPAGAALAGFVFRAMGGSPPWLAAGAALLGMAGGWLLGAIVADLAFNAQDLAMQAFFAFLGVFVVPWSIPPWLTALLAWWVARRGSVKLATA
ncbi:MAG: hypothetical protein U0821_23895 [Chloroflexota bacterium]